MELVRGSTLAWGLALALVGDCSLSGWDALVVGLFFSALEE